MSDLDSLLRAVRERPGDDALRLIVADCFEENGDQARAEFVRVQLRIAALQRDCSCASCVKRRGGGQCTNGPCAVDQERDELPGGGSRRAYLRMRAGELWWGGPPERGSWQANVSALPPGIGVSPGGVRRGFVASVRTTLALWLGHGQRAVESHPVEELVIVDREPITGEGASRWLLWSDNPYHDGWRLHRNRESLPVAVWKKLPRANTNATVAEYDAPALAKSALGHAALMLMRERAKLPLWNWNPDDKENA